MYLWQKDSGFFFQMRIPVAQAVNLGATPLRVWLGPMQKREALKRASGLVALPGFVSADWRFAASYLGCSLPAVAGAVMMENSGGAFVGRKQVATSLVVAGCGAEVAEFQRAFDVFSQGRTVMIYASSPSPTRGRHGVSITCTLETAAQPGMPVSVMLMPIELVVL